MEVSPDYRHKPDRPIVGVGVVVWQGARVLLVRRGREPARGQWSLPGGAQQVGETVFDAAAREVREETGLAIEVVALVDVVDGITRNSAGEVLYHYTLVDVVARSQQGEPRADDDAEEARWFELDELPALGLWSETERIIHQSRLLL